MKKKTVNSIFKGIAGVGLTLGGVSVLSDANIVYAEELDEQFQEQLEQPTVEELEQQASASVTEMQSVSEASSESGAESVAAVTEQSTADSTEASESASEAGANSAADSESAAASQDIVESTSESTLSAIQSEEGSLSESMTAASSEFTSASEAASEAEVNYNSALADFEESSQRDETLEKLISEITEAQENVAAEKAKPIVNGNTKVDATYYRAADKLANLLIQYKFYQEGYVGKITYSNWVSNENSSGFVQNHVKVTYDVLDQDNKPVLDEAGKQVQNEAYFDYVTADEAEKWLFGTSDANTAKKIDHIMVVQKDPVFTNQVNEGEQADTFTNGHDDDGNVQYKVNDQVIADGVEEIKKEGTDKVIKKITTSISGSNAEGFTVTKKTETLKEDGTVESIDTTSTSYNKRKQFVDKGWNYFSEKEFNEAKDNYRKTADREQLTAAEQRRSEANSTVNSLNLISQQNSLSLSKIISSAEKSMSAAKATSEANSSVASASLLEVSQQSAANSNSAFESSSLAASTSEASSISESNSYRDANSTIDSLYDRINQLRSTAQPGTSYPASVTAPVAPTTTTEITDEDVPLSDAEIDEEKETEKEAEKDTSKSADAAKTDEAVTTLEDEDVPLSDGIDDAVGTEIADEDVPLAVIDMNESTELLDEDVPLSDNPETGDAMTMTWLGTAAAAVTGLFGASKGKKKKNAD